MNTRSTSPEPGGPDGFPDTEPLPSYTSRAKFGEEITSVSTITVILSTSVCDRCSA